MNNAVINILLHKSFWHSNFSSFVHTSLSMIAGSYSSFTCSLLRKLYLVFHTTLLIHIPSDCTWQFLTLWCYCCISDNCLSRWGNMISHCAFDLCFPDDLYCWRIFHILGHLYIHFWEMSIQNIFPFLIGLFDPKLLELLWNSAY